MVDKCEGSYDYDVLEYFSGFKSIKNEENLIYLCGVDQETFNYFLTLIDNQNYSEKSKEDKLLLSLVKLKLGISFTSISVFFNLHRSTCSRIFKHVLKTLAVATKILSFGLVKKLYFPLYQILLNTIIQTVELLLTVQKSKLNNLLMLIKEFICILTINLLILVNFWLQ